MEKELADQVIAFASEHNIIGVTLQEDSKRYYPYGDLAAGVLGFVNDENNGAYGIEAYYNQTLSGTNGKQVSIKNAQGRDMSFRYEDLYAANDGNSIELTIDATIQQILDKNLKTAVEEHGVGNRAAGIIIDVNTGAILGMSTQPSFDPNEPYVIQDEKLAASVEALLGSGEEYAAARNEAWFYQWSNKCITEPYEPGSVFKTITLSAGLETGVCSLNSSYYCPGYHIVNGVRKNCWKLAGHGSQNLAQAVQNSCNPAFMMIGQGLGGERFYDFFENFGLTSVTGIDLPGEAESLYHSKKALANVNDHENSLTSSSFGQTFKVTPIQVVTAIAAAVNGGYLYEPYIVAKVVDADGNTVSETEPTLKRQVISEETSALVCDILESVVSNGSGRNAYVPGYRIGGKTGTSQKIDLLSSTGEEEYILSFVGIAPMDNPQIACLVLLDEPEVKNSYGSTIAAPVVGTILSEVLPYLGIEKIYSEQEMESADIAISNYVGQEPHTAQAAITRLGLSSKVMGSGGKVISQVPAAYSEVPRNGTVILYTDEESQSDTVIVPDVLDMSGLSANQAILNAGLNIRITGVNIEDTNAIAAKQDPAAGTEVRRGTIVTVDFADATMQNFAHTLIE